MRTLRLPLAARALGDALFPDLALHDGSAPALLAQLGDDGSGWLRARDIVYSVLKRTRIIRDCVRQFLAQWPGAHVVNLGCGLSDYFQWLDNGAMRLVNADLPQVIALRRRLLRAHRRRERLVALDLRRAGWWHRLRMGSAFHAAPMLAFSEGVLVYLQRQEVAAVLAEFAEQAPAGSLFVLDAPNALALGLAWARPTIGLSGARFNWGMHAPGDLTAPHPRLRLCASHEVMASYGWPYSVLCPATFLTTGVRLYGVYVLRVAER